VLVINKAREEKKLELLRHLKWSFVVSSAPLGLLLIGPLFGEGRRDPAAGLALNLQITFFVFFGGPLGWLVTIGHLIGWLVSPWLPAKGRRQVKAVKPKPRSKKKHSEVELFVFFDGPLALIFLAYQLLIRRAGSKSNSAASENRVEKPRRFKSRRRRRNRRRSTLD
jgi:hypothetical protein